jgi:hypothetical protein
MDDANSPPRIHLSQFYTALVEVRAAVDVLFDTLAYMEAGDDEERYRAFKEALYERQEHAKANHLERISDLVAGNRDVGGEPVGASASTAHVEEQADAEADADA